MRRSRRVWHGAALGALAVAIAVTAAACGGSSNSSSSSSSPRRTRGASFVGAGSTFAEPLYTAWAQTYQGVSGGVKLNYQAIGSAAASPRSRPRPSTSAPPTPRCSEADLTTNGLVQFPMTVGGNVVVVNLERRRRRLAQARRPDVLASIYMGKITMWNDPAIKATNPGVTLPGDARSPSSTAPTARAPRGSSRTTSRPPRPAWKSQAGADKSPLAGGHRRRQAAPASPPASSSSAARSATWSTPTPSRPA